MKTLLSSPKVIIIIIIIVIITIILLLLWYNIYIYTFVIKINIDEWIM